MHFTALLTEEPEFLPLFLSLPVLAALIGFVGLRKRVRFATAALIAILGSAISYSTIVFLEEPTPFLAFVLADSFFIGGALIALVMAGLRSLFGWPPPRNC